MIIIKSTFWLGLLCGVAFGGLRLPRQGEKTLKLIFTIFRHGERTPDPPPYPLDPYKNLTWAPYGYGQLTNAGKQREFNIGKCLRFEYLWFLGKVYYDGIVKARSSSYGRTKNSLQLALAGLFPPKEFNVWSDHDFISTFWQPIAFDSKPLDDDPEILGLFCETYKNLFNDFTKTQHYQDILQKHSKLLKYLEKNTGIIPFNDLNQAHNLFYTLASQKALGLPLPKWTDSVYPERMEDALVDAYITQAGTPELKKYATGFLLKDIILEIGKKQTGSLDEGRKIYLYSGHEVNVAHMMITLGVYYPHSPSFGAYLVLELHQGSDGIFFLRLFHENYEKEKPVLMEIPGCGVDCPVEKFLEIVAKFLPGTQDKCGKKCVV